MRWRFSVLAATIGIPSRFVWHSLSGLSVPSSYSDWQLLTPMNHARSGVPLFWPTSIAAADTDATILPGGFFCQGGVYAVWTSASHSYCSMASATAALT
jgi:hypothetical protein